MFYNDFKMFYSMLDVLVKTSWFFLTVSYKIANQNVKMGTSFDVYCDANSADIPDNALGIILMDVTWTDKYKNTETHGFSVEKGKYSLRVSCIIYRITFWVTRIKLQL